MNRFATRRKETELNGLALMREEKEENGMERKRDGTSIIGYDFRKGA